MKRLKKMIVTLGAVAALGGAAAAITAPVASAANCVASAGGARNQAGNVNAPIQLSSCTGITAIRFVRLNPGYINSGYADNNLQQWITSGINGCNCDITIQTTLGGNAFLSQPCWYHGVSHNVVPYFLFQIKNSVAPFNWGPLHDFLGDPNGVYVPCS